MKYFLLLFMLSCFTACSFTTAEPFEEHICAADELDNLFIDEAREADDYILIEPSDESFLYPEFGIRHKDLFVKNRDTLTSYKLSCDLVQTIGEVLALKQEYERSTGRNLSVRFNSLVRSAYYNRKIGGVANSEHLDPIGHAVDIQFGTDWKAKHFVSHLYREVQREGSEFRRLHNKGCRSFGFYEWGIHLGVRERTKGWRAYNQGIYAVWDKRQS